MSDHHKFVYTTGRRLPFRLTVNQGHLTQVRRDASGRAAKELYAPVSLSLSATVDLTPTAGQYNPDGFRPARRDRPERSRPPVGHRGEESPGGRVLSVEPTRLAQDGTDRHERLLSSLRVRNGIDRAVRFRPVITARFRPDRGIGTQGHKDGHKTMRQAQNGRLSLRLFGLRHSLSEFPLIASDGSFACSYSLFCRGRFLTYLR